MSRRILITGAGSGLGEGAALGLARGGHEVIACAETWPQVTALRHKVESMGLKTLRAEKFNLLDPIDTARCSSWEFDVLVNNGAIGEGGPIAEVPLEVVRRTFEVNVFATLALTQSIVKRWVRSKIEGKVVFISSMGGLFSPPGFAPYAATKHAIEAIAEAMQGEVKPYGIQVQTINPGAYLTGFNEAMAENAFRWLNDGANFTTIAHMREMAAGLIGSDQGRLNPEEMIRRMIEVIPAATGTFRNVFPPFVEKALKAHQAEMFTRPI